jgi:hypothetical protein
MRFLVLLLVCLTLSETLYAVGIKKKRLLIYVRRELVPSSQATTPTELHRPSENYHELRCRTAGWGCGWKRRPWLSTRHFTLEAIDQRVADLTRGAAASTRVFQGTFEVGDLGVYYRSLPGGYEYHIVEGGDVDGELDALIIAAKLRGSSGRRVRATADGRSLD